MARRGVLLVRAFAALGGLSQSLAGAAAALLAQEVAGSDAVGGLPQSLVVIGAGASAVGLAALARRLGRAVALALGGATAGVGCLAMALGGVVAMLLPVLLGSLLLGAGNTAVMLSRYAAAELEPARPAPRAMAWVLVATSFGAVLGPNLIQPSATLATPLGVSPLIGSYVLAAAVYLVGAAVVWRARTVLPPVREARVAEGPQVAPLRGGALPPEATARHGLAILAVANLVMVGVMTMAPIHISHQGGHLWLVGLVVSLHIGAMFGPSALSGRLVLRMGARRAASAGAALLVAACILAARSGSSSAALAAAMVALGLGWNVALVAGSDLLTRGVTAARRPGRESAGEVGMAVAAALGGASSGLVTARWDYATLALLGAAASVGLLVRLAISARLIPH